jgi:hypothetical protein
LEAFYRFDILGAEKNLHTHKNSVSRLKSLIPNPKSLTMKLIAYPLAAALGFFGIMFVVSARPMSIIVGVILMAAAVALVLLAMLKPKQVENTFVQKIDLSGDVNVEQMKCRSCGGNLNKDSISVRAGGIFINCPYCGSAYQLEEAPKW